ncbi:hypothetical protein [Actinocorallia populi]|nr:hypothetical protein [Actinocorallia populi]
MSIRWWVGDTEMVPEGAPRILAEMVLTVFGDPGAEPNGSPPPC